MQITKKTDSLTIKKQIGKRAAAIVNSTRRSVTGLFIGFWNPNFTDQNSQTDATLVSCLEYPFNLLTVEGARVPVDCFVTFE